MIKIYIYTKNSYLLHICPNSSPAKKTEFYKDDAGFITGGGGANVQISAPSKLPLQIICKSF
jgi:hypothetical protein